MISLTEDKRMLGYDLLKACPGIFHFVTTRRGGCGEGAYASFNCSPYSGDKMEHVAYNQRLLLESFPGGTGRLIIPKQVHGTEIRVIDTSFAALTPEEQRCRLEGVDALVTNLTDYCLCVSTADCVPLLLYDKRNRAVAAIHAGWRGTVKLIVAATLEMMAEVYGTRGSDLTACIGPAISPESFEVGDEVHDAFLELGYDMECLSFFNEFTGKYHIDLWEANRLQLLDFGVPGDQIEVSGVCTYKHYKEFFSARRLGIDSGRILSGIMLACSQ